MEGDSIYISLQEATQHCGYSQEYLSLRARQGKLKAIKFGRNWVTKKEWLEEYLGQTEEYKNNLNNKKVVFATVPPPANLPIERPAPLTRFGFIMALAFVLAVTVTFHGRESFYPVRDSIVTFATDISTKISNGVQNAFQDATPLVVDFSENFDRGLAMTMEEINLQISESVYQMASASQATTGVVQEYFQWLGRQYINANNFVEQKLSIVNGFDLLVPNYVKANDSLEKNLSEDINDLVQGYNLLVSNVKKEIYSLARSVESAYQFVIRPWREAPEISVVEKIVRPQPEEGAIVVPYPKEKTAEVKGKLETAFSDKVEIKPDESGRAGIIKPLIKEAAAQEYLYLIVPVNETQINTDGNTD